MRSKWCSAQLLEKTSGLSVFCAEDAVAVELCDGRKGGISYGWSRENDFSANIIELRPAQTEFEVFADKELLGKVVLGIPGKHNVLNALAAVGNRDKIGRAVRPGEAGAGIIPRRPAAVRIEVRGRRTSRSSMTTGTIPRRSRRPWRRRAR